MNHPILRHIPGARQWIKKIERLTAERDRLARRLQKLQRERRRTNPAPAPLRRESYKQVWSELSRDERSAKLHVGGFEDEASFARTGVETRDAILSSVGIRADEVVVEIGCGVGRVGAQLAPLCRKWVGCDVSPHMLAITAKRLAHFQNIELHETNGFDLRALPDASADVVYCTVVFMHLEEWDRYNYVLEARRVLRPGGRIFIDNVNLCADTGWQVFEAHRPILPEQRPLHITRHSTEQELTTYLSRAGFGDLQSREAREFIQVWGRKPAAVSSMKNVEWCAHLEAPAPGAAVYAEAISMSGWLWRRDADMSHCEVRAWQGEEVIGQTRLFFPRPEISGEVSTGFRLLARAASLHPELRFTARWEEKTEVEFARANVRLLPCRPEWPHAEVAAPGQTRVLHRADIYGSGPPVETPGAETLQLIQQYLPANASVLDIGCGAGAYGPALIAGGQRWLGLEVDEVCLEILAQRKLPHRAVLRHSDALPCTDEEFDHVICIEVLEHIAQPDVFLGEIRRVIRERVLLSVPNLEVLPYLSGWQAVPWHLLEATHRNFFTRSNLRELLCRHFRAVEVFSFAEHPLRTRDNIPIHAHLFAVAQK